MRKSVENQVIDLARRMGLLRPRDLRDAGVRPEYLSRLARDGRLARRGRGLYALPEEEISEHHSFAEAAKRAPAGVICLLSALRRHNLTTQAPFEVWMAVDRKARLPRPGIVRIRFVRFSGQALTSGVERHVIDGVPVNVYGVAKTIADCFKYRNKIGLDVALEALREGWRERRFTMDEIWKYAKACRVANVMRPYLESLV